MMPDDFRRKAETYKAELFKDGRLDFPNAKTNKNSKKYVRSMRKLSVSCSLARDNAAFTDLPFPRRVCRRR